MKTLSQTSVAATELTVHAQETDAEETPWLAFGAIAGPVVLTLAWFVLGLIRPATRTEWGVSGGVTGMVTQPFSGLGIGHNGFLFNVAFVLSGALLLVGIFGVFQTIDANDWPVARKACAALLALSALGLVVCGLFTLESFLPHMLGFVLGCATPVLSFLATGLLLRRVATWRRFGSWPLLGSPLTALLLVVFFLTFDQASMAAGLGIAGLTERVLVLEVQGWFVAMGWLALRHHVLRPRDVV